MATKAKVSTTTTPTGFGQLAVIGIVFVVLKLVGVINWSWWWVLSPFLVIPVLVVVIIGVSIWYYASTKRF